MKEIATKIDLVKASEKEILQMLYSNQVLIIQKLIRLEDIIMKNQSPEEKLKNVHKDELLSILQAQQSSFAAAYKQFQKTHQEES